MNAFRTLLAVVLVAAALVGVVRATDTTAKFTDAGVAHIESGVAYVDVSAAVYTSYVNLLTIENDQAMVDVTIVIDLDFGTDDINGFAGGYTSETIQFAVARKIQGNWRVDDEVETATVAGDSADLRSVTLRPVITGPVEDLRVYVKLSAEQADVTLPYVVYYRAQQKATFTPVSN